MAYKLFFLVLIFTFSSSHLFPNSDTLQCKDRRSLSFEGCQVKIPAAWEACTENHGADACFIIKDKDLPTFFNGAPLKASFTVSRKEIDNLDELGEIIKSEYEEVPDNFFLSPDAPDYDKKPDFMKKKFFEPVEYKLESKFSEEHLLYKGRSYLKSERLFESKYCIGLVAKGGQSFILSLRFFHYDKTFSAEKAFQFEKYVMEVLEHISLN